MQDADQNPQSDGGRGAEPLIASEQLLFGIIALQNNFVTREQFVAAFDAWVQDKSRALAEILQGQGALSPDDREILGRLVAKFLEKYAGDADKSLAALSAIPQVRPDLEQLQDADLAASLGHVGLAVPPDPQLQMTIPFADDSPRGRFRILRPHATGGLGQVSVALDQELNREVALKELLPKLAGSPVSRERFLQEAEITGALEHPGIVPVYALGRGSDGRPFYAMRLVKGDSLKTAIESFHRPDNPNRKDPGARQLALRQLLGRFIDVCNAIEYAHSRGVLHRDLKPGNIMIGKHGETLVVDWGLAKAVGKKEIETDEATLRPSFSISSSGHTLPGSAVGTPGYMSPEQAAGKLDELKPTTDVYCLGATLYHVLTGKPPFERHSDLAGILARVQRGDFRPPRAVESNVPPPLEAICLRAMSLKPADRYPSASALADDLEHWLADEPVSAAPDSPSQRLGRLARKHRGYVRAGALALLLVAVVSTVAALLIDEQRRHNATLANEKTQLADEKATLAESERQAKTEAQQLAQERGRLANRNAQLAEDERLARLDTERQLLIARAERLAALSHTTRPESPEISLTLAIESGLAAHADDGGPLPTSHQALLDSLSAIGGKPLVGHHGEIRRVMISPDGRWIVTVSQDMTVRLWDLTAENPAANSRVLFGELEGGFAAAVSADSHWIVTADSHVRVWDLTAEDPAAKHLVLKGNQASFPILCLAVSPDSRWVVGGDFDKLALVWDLSDPEAGPRVLAGHEKQVHNLAISADSRWLATGSDDATVRVWDLAADDPGANPRLLAGHTDRVSGLAISSDGRWLVSGSYDNTARVWGLAAADPGTEPRLLEHPRPVMCVGFSPDGRWLVTGSDQPRVWRLTAEGPAAEAQILDGHRGTVSSVVFSRDSQMVVTGSWDKSAIVWDLMQTIPATKAVFRGHAAQIDSVAISPDGRWIVTGGHDNAPRVWDLKGEKYSENPRVLRVDRPHIKDVAISPDGRWIVTGGEEARLWDLRAANPAANPRVLPGYQGMIESVAISPDSWAIAAACDDNMVRVWELAVEQTSAQPRVLAGHEGSVFAVAISPNGRWIVTGSKDKTARVWDLSADESAAKPRVLGGHDSPVMFVAISPDSRRAITVAGAAHLWDLQSEDPSARPVVLSDNWLPMIQCAAFSPDSRQVVTGSADGIARIWDLTAPDPTVNPLRLKGHQYGIYAAAFHGDGRRLITAGRDSAARVWDLAAEDPAANPIILVGHLAKIGSVAITPDDRWLVTGSDDRTARIWDLAAPNPGATARVLRGHASTVNGVVIAPDGRHIVTWSYDRTARVWRWQWDDLVKMAVDVARNLDAREWNEHFAGQPYRKTFPDLPIPGEPETARDYFVRAKERLLKGEGESAIEDFSEAIRLDPTMADAFLNRGHAWFWRGEHDKALDDYTETIRANPNWDVPYLDRSIAWTKKGQFENGLADLNAAIRLAPGGWRAYVQRANLYASSADARFRSGNQAIADATQACNLTDWKNVGALSALAAAFAEAGQFDDAVRWQTKALDLLPEALDLKAGYAERLVLYKSGQPYRESGSPADK
jgi:WD40 repeat protein/serine/threonine protein kinase